MPRRNHPLPAPSARRKTRKATSRQANAATRDTPPANRPSELRHTPPVLSTSRTTSSIPPARQHRPTPHLTRPIRDECPALATVDLEGRGSKGSPYPGGVNGGFRWTRGVAPPFDSVTGQEAKR